VTADRPTVARTATIRPARAADVPVIHALLADLAETLDESASMTASEADLLREGFGHPPAFQVLLAEQDDRPVGLVLFFHAYSSWRGRLGVYVQDLHVVGAMRGSGLGRRLLAAAADAGRTAGCSHMRLSVAATNAAGRGFYRRIGMAERHDEVICQISDRDFVRLAERAGRF